MSIRCKVLKKICCSGLGRKLELEGGNVGSSISRFFVSIYRSRFKIPDEL